MATEGYIWESPNWPNFIWDEKSLSEKLQRIRYKQGRIGGQIDALGFQQRENLVVDILTSGIVKSSQIEGEILDLEQVRSSVARHLGITHDEPVITSRDVEGVVHIALDAIYNSKQPLTTERLYEWHGALFQSGRDEWGRKLQVGNWRNDSGGKMTIRSGAFGHERVHYEAPPASLIPQEMEKFLNWFNDPHSVEPVLKASVAHLWFVAIHPFQDGNGRITRNISDLALTRADYNSMRFYSMSTQIAQEKKGYYQALDDTTSSPRMDITLWNNWFLDCLEHSIDSTSRMLETVVEKAKFFQHHNNGASFNERQTKIINRLFDGFHGTLTSEKWRKMTKTSLPTALRDIDDLITKGVLRREGAGKATHYFLIADPASAASLTTAKATALTPSAAQVEAENAYIEASQWLNKKIMEIVEIAERGQKAVQRAQSESLRPAERRGSMEDAEKIDDELSSAWQTTLKQGQAISKKLSERLENCKPYQGNWQEQFDQKRTKQPEEMRLFMSELKVARLTNKKKNDQEIDI